MASNVIILACLRINVFKKRLERAEKNVADLQKKYENDVQLLQKKCEEDLKVRNEYILRKVQKQEEELAKLREIVNDYIKRETHEKFD